MRPVPLHRGEGYNNSTVTSKCMQPLSRLGRGYYIMMVHTILLSGLTRTDSWLFKVVIRGSSLSFLIDTHVILKGAKR